METSSTAFTKLLICIKAEGQLSKQYSTQPTAARHDMASMARPGRMLQTVCIQEPCDLPQNQESDASYLRDLSYVFLIIGLPLLSMGVAMCLCAPANPDPAPAAAGRGVQHRNVAVDIVAGRHDIHPAARNTRVAANRNINGIAPALPAAPRAMPVQARANPCAVAAVGLPDEAAAAGAKPAAADTAVPIDVNSVD